VAAGVEPEMSLATPRPARLLNRDFLLLWQGQFVSVAGSQGSFLAMMYWTKEVTDSASLMGLLMMLSVLPGIVIGPLAGTIADRHSRRGILLASNVLSWLITLAVGLTFLRGGDPRALTAMLFTMVLAIGLMQAFFRPTIVAAIPDLVPGERLMAANSMSQFSMQVSTVVGMGAGGVVYAWLGAPLLFLADSLTYLYAALCLLPVKIPAPRAQTERPHFRRDLAEGLWFVWSRPGMRDFLLMVATINFLLIPVIVLLPFYVERNLGEGAEWYGFLLAAHSLGSLTGLAVAGVARIRRRAGFLMSLVVVVGLVWIVMGLVHDGRLAAVTMFAGGAMGGIFNVLTLTVFQIATPAELRGRVTGLLMTIAMGVMPLGMLAGGVAGDLTGQNTPLLYAVCGTLTTCATLFFATRRPLREFLAATPDTLASPASRQGKPH
jgi:MFS transporter, DHA3 family, macrolide efflux protein